MRVRPRPGGIPLVVHVSVLLLLPLTGLAFFSVREVGHNNDTAQASSLIAESIELQSAATNVLGPLEVDRVSLLGLTRIDEFGVDRSIVIGFTGLDLDAIRADNTNVLVASMDALVEVVQTDARAVTAGFDVRLLQIREALAEHRVRVDAGTGSLADIGATFDELDNLLVDIVALTDDTLGSLAVIPVESDRLLRELQTIAGLKRTASVQAATTIDAVVSADGGSALDVAVATQRHRDSLLAAEEFATGEDLSALFDAYVALTPPNAAIFERVQVDPGELLTDPSIFAEVTTLFLEQIDYLDQMETFGVARSTDLSQRADQLADDARRRNRVAFFALVGVGMGSLLVGAVIIGSFVRPLRRLRHEAEQISNGAFTVNPLPIEGPSDVRKVTATVNEMASTLALVDAHMKALATGSRHEHQQLEDLPGEVGRSMHHSIKRVTALTTNLKESEAKLEVQARRDTLTGLPNRFAMFEHLDTKLAGTSDSSGIGIMFVDIDGFKTVNDTYGHSVGDVVLGEIARRLRTSVRDGDFVARLGGDEFLIVTDRCADHASLVAFGDRIIAEIECPVTIGEQLVGVSASVGATVSKSTDSSVAAIERADAAVYHAKHRGRRRTEMFDEELQHSIERHAEIELALRRAIHEGELRLHLQPLGDIVSGAVTGAEALVRWQRPGVGLVPPGEFIPVAETSGLIFELERWVLLAACEQVVEWRETDPSCQLRLAINISGRHLIEGDLIGDIRAALEATGADPKMLEIELTESHLLDDVERAGEVLAEIRQLGIRVAIDDFGTGYSSMTYLQKLPVDSVKIDRSFISRAAENDFDSTFVEAIVKLARMLALDVVAEGVETPEQLAYVAAQGVQKVQGFLLARPMPADEANKIIFGGPLIDPSCVAALLDA